MIEILIELVIEKSTNIRDKQILKQNFYMNDSSILHDNKWYISWIFWCNDIFYHMISFYNHKTFELIQHSIFFESSLEEIIYSFCFIWFCFWSSLQEQRRDFWHYICDLRSHALLTICKWYFEVLEVHKHKFFSQTWS